MLGGADSIPAQGDRIPHALQPKNQKYKKQKQHHNKFDKNFRTVYIKKKSLKKSTDTIKSSSEKATQTGVKVNSPTSEATLDLVTGFQV